MTARVAVTGLGLVSCLGHDYRQALERLRRGESGVRAVPEWGRIGLRSQVAGTLEDVETKLGQAGLPKKLVPGMSEAALYSALAARDAVADAGLEPAELASERVGCFVGAGTVSVDSVYRAAELTYAGKVRRVDPFAVLRAMASSPSAAVANLFRIRGPSYSIASACATSAHAIGHAFDQVRAGRLDLALAGGGEAVDELVASSFDALRLALSSRYNDRPAAASRPYDRGRDGFVVSGGGAVLVLESLERARARGARVRAEVAGFGATSDGYDLVLPEPGGEAAAACMAAALADAGRDARSVGYVNTHGTSTVAGDLAEVRAMRRAFGPRLPPFSSTKSMTGHGLGAAGGLEAVFCVGMLEGSFLAPSINVDEIDPEIDGEPLVRETRAEDLETVLSNNFGFGGTNASLVFLRADG